MKKALSLILAVVLCLSLCAGGTNSANPTESNTENNNGTANADTEKLAMYNGEWKEYERKNNHQKQTLQLYICVDHTCHYSIRLHFVLVWRRTFI